MEKKNAKRWRYVRLGIVSNIFKYIHTNRKLLAGFNDCPVTWGMNKYPTVGSSGESWSINESLNQRFAEMSGLKESRRLRQL